MITLWGPTSSGKTALLSLLYLRAKAEQRDWDIFPTSLSLEMVEAQSQRIEIENEFPVGTKEGTADERQLSYKFQLKTTGEEFVLETADRAGSRSVAMDDELIASLKAAQGIVLFLDPDRAHRDSEVKMALAKMYASRADEKNNRDPRPLAVCLSKVDRLIAQPDDYRRLKEQPEQFVREQLGRELLDWIDNYHSNKRFFPVSAVGIKLSYGTVQKSVFFDERLALRVTSQGTPINIMEPFLWIFESLREVV